MTVETAAVPAEPEPHYLRGAAARLAARGGPLGISRALANELARRWEIPTMQLGRRRDVHCTALATLNAGASGELA